MLAIRPSIHPSVYPSVHPLSLPNSKLPAIATNDNGPNNPEERNKQTAMLLSAIPRSSSNSLLLLRNHILTSTSTSSPTATNLLSTATTLKPLLRAPSASSLTASNGNLENPIHHVTHSLSDDDEEAGGGSGLVSSASAVASAIRSGSSSPVEFVQKIEKGHNNNKTKLVLPSPDFQRLCVQQLDLFHRIVDPDAILSVCPVLLLH